MAEVVLVKPPRLALLPPIPKPVKTYGWGAPISGIVKHPTGLVIIQPTRSLVSPFEQRFTAAVQRIQLWVGHPDELSDQQVKRTGALTLIAKDAAGTYGSSIDPLTGRLMPNIAIKVRELMWKAGLVYKTTEEFWTARRAFALRYRREKLMHRKVKFPTYFVKLEAQYPEAHKALEADIAAGIPAVTYVPSTYKSPT